MRRPRLLFCLAIGMSLIAATASAQTPCPLAGWSEGLPSNLGPKATFPVTDTAVNHDSSQWIFPADCAFHEWSWESFVWATDFYWQYPPDQSGNLDRRPRFMGLHTPAELKGGEPAGDRLMLSPRTLKPGSRIAKFQQAGSDGILVDLQNEAVYYSVHMNDLYFGFTQKYYGKTAYNAASTTLSYPVGAAVFKAGWKIVSENERTDWYTTSATIPVLTTDSKGNVVPDPGGKTRDVTVALVALHVVGRTDNHPEFIWASFEHNANAPVLPSNLKPSSPEPVSSHDYTFYTANTAAKDCNQLVLKPSVNGNKLTPATQVFRRYPRGGLNGLKPSQFDAINSNAQKEMRALARPQVPGIPAYPKNTVWANYHMIGTTWQPVDETVKYPKPIPPTVKPGDSNLFNTAVGSVQLASAILETFVQGPETNAGSPANCFQCHHTGGSTKVGYPGKVINLSHMILQGYSE